MRLRTPYCLDSLLSRLSFPLLIALPLSFSTTGILYIRLCTYVYLYTDICICTVCISVCMCIYKINIIFHLSIRTNFHPFGGDITPVENAWSRCIIVQCCSYIEGNLLTKLETNCSEELVFQLYHWLLGLSSASQNISSISLLPLLLYVHSLPLVPILSHQIYLPCLSIFCMVSAYLHLYFIMDYI